MYESYWQLQHKPFENDSEQRSFYPSDVHQGAMLKLRYAIENHLEAVVLSGAAGTGKTLLFSLLRNQLSEGLGPWAHMVFPQMPPEHLLAWLADELGAEKRLPECHGVEDSVRRIESLLRKNFEQGRHAVVAIDEAHLLEETGGLETARLLLNLKQDGRPLMTLLLLGQPRLLTCLDRMPGLEQRLGVKCLLRPFTLEETISYIQHRLNAAEAAREIMSESTMEAVHYAASGLPRHINRICDLALLIGFAEERDCISPEQIESVAGELAQVEVD